MPLNLYLTDTFNRGTTSAVAGADSTGGIGNGWIDHPGNTWHLSSNTVVASPPDYRSGYMYRPTSENSLSQRAVINCGIVGIPVVMLRLNPSTNASYAAYHDSNNLNVSTFIGGANTVLSSGAFTWSNSVSYIIDFTAVANATTGTDLTAVLYDAAAPSTPLVTVTVTGNTQSGLQVAGTYGICGASTWANAASANLYNGTVAGTVVASPTTFPLGVATSFTLTGSGTSWTGSTQPTVAGGTNAYVSNMSVSGQVLSGTLNPGSTVATLTLGDTTDSATTTVSATANVLNNIVWHGDSLTSGQGGTGAGTTAATRLAVVFKALGPTWQGTNYGNNGHTLTQMIAELGSNVNALYDGSKQNNYLIVQGGHNDIGGGGASAATVISRIQSYVSTALAAHPWKIIWSTEPPAAYPSVYPYNFDSIRDTVNAYMRLNWQKLGIAALADFALDARMGLDGSQYNSTYYSASDFTHPTDAGYTIWGQYDLAAVNQINGAAARRWTHY